MGSCCKHVVQDQQIAHCVVVAYVMLIADVVLVAGVEVAAEL